jgi:hypothetical protein
MTPSLTSDAMASAPTISSGISTPIADGQCAVRAYSLVWEEDVYEDGRDRQRVEANSSTSAESEVVIRLFSTKSNGVGVSMYIDEPCIFVNGDRVDADWQFESNVANLDDYVQMHETVRSVLRGR